MTDAPFIVAGWLGTAAAIGTYALSISIRTRRATRARAQSVRTPK